MQKPDRSITGNVICNASKPRRVVTGIAFTACLPAFRKALTMARAGYSLAGVGFILYTGQSLRVVPGLAVANRFVVVAWFAVSVPGAGNAFARIVDVVLDAVQLLRMIAFVTVACGIAIGIKNTGSVIGTGDTVTRVGLLDARQPRGDVAFVALTVRISVLDDTSTMPGAVHPLAGLLG